MTEKSVVNLAFCSGLMGHSLGLDKPYPTAAPSTGNGTYDFAFRPHSALPEVREHVRGQVEVDAVFMVVAAGWPWWSQSRALPDRWRRHKLTYPVLALAKQVPADIPIVPVYIRILVSDHVVQYHVVERQVPDPRDGTVSLDPLRPVSADYVARPRT